MTPLKQGQSLKRSVRIYGVDKPVCVEITADGIRMWIKGFKKSTRIGWLTVAEASTTPVDVPSYLHGNPLALLRHQAETLIQKEGN